MGPWYPWQPPPHGIWCRGRGSSVEIVSTCVGRYKGAVDDMDI